MITITLAPCPCVDKPFAAVTTETVAFTGADVPDGLQAALFDGSGTCLAIGDVAGGKAELDLDTQEAVDATAPVGPGEDVTVWLVVGDKDTHIATIPCQLIRNLIDDEATHPHVPAERYPTVSELNAWLEAAGELREGVCTCATAAASSAEAAASSARLSSAQALAAVNAANGASASAKAASVSAEQAASEGVAAAKSAQAAKASESAAGQAAEQAATQASGAARSATQANASAQAAASSATAASQSAAQAGSALEDAQTARVDAQAARDAAKASETAAAERAKAASASAEQAQEAKAGAEAAKSGAEAAQKAAEAAKAGAESAKASAEAKAQESATSATQAAQSATAAAGSATQAEEAKKAVEETEDWIGRVRLAPDSPLVVEWAAPCVKRINTLDDSLLAAVSKFAVTTDGYHIIAHTRGKRPYKLYILGKDYKVQWSGELHVNDGGATGGSLMAWVDDAGGFAITLTTRLTRWQLNADGTMTKLAEADIGSVWQSQYDNNNFIYNPLTGNVFIETFVPDPEVEGTAQVRHWLKFDGQMNLLGRADDVLPKGTGFPFFVFWDTSTATTGRRAYVVHKGPDDTYKTLKWLDAEDNFIEVHDTDGDPVYFDVNGSAVGLSSGRAWMTPTITTDRLRNGFWNYQIQSYDENGVMVLKKYTREDIASNIPDYKAGTGSVYGIVNYNWGGQYGLSYVANNILSARPGLMMFSGFINLVGLDEAQTPLGIQGVGNKDIIILSRNVLYIE